MNPALPTTAPAASSGSRHTFALERAAILHAGVLLVFASWAFGGNVRWAENVILAIGALSPLLTFAELRRRRTARQSFQPFAALIPILVFSAFVVISSLRPSFSANTIEGATVFFPKPTATWLPSSARPELSLRALLLFLAVYLPCFNLSICVRSRRALVRLLTVLVANSVVLAVFGSLQKLTHSAGLYFGAVHSPNTRFFASFIYQNHWGAFAVLMLATGWGLLFREAPSGRYRSFVQSPAFLGLVALLLLATSAPLSASRSCTVLSVLVTGVAVVHGLRRVARERNRSGKSARTFVSLAVAVIVFAGAAIYQLAWPVMEARFSDTRLQLAQMQQTRSLGGRADLYRDTWSMANERLAFGWGLGSYPTVFTRFNRQVSVDRLPIYYEDAHSDWLQLLAETGIAGTLCFAMAVALPLVSLRKFRPITATPAYILSGCATILVYALLEFPFGNHAVVLSFWLCLFSGVRLAQLDARERSA